MNPSYLTASKTGRLDAVINAVYPLLSACSICPRKCKVNRLKGETGFCKTGLQPEVYSFLAHHGEEPPISGTKGSGTIFFSHCNMACVYCQNYEFSQEIKQGGGVSNQELAKIMFNLQESGCHNINLVSPTHIMPQILKSLKIAINMGLNIPLVYNTSGYELPEMIKMLDGIIDVYLPDMRYADTTLSQKFSNAPKYPFYNQASIKEMHRQVGIAQINDKGIIKKGLIVRHLVLPANISGTEKIMKFLAQEVSANTYISLMSQYTPYYKACDYPELNHRLNSNEYEAAQNSMDKYGLHNGWMQDSGGLERFAGVNIKPVK
ncbi:MAG: radical SAM protein [Candidatus Omnitrophota bacterium]